MRAESDPKCSDADMGEFDRLKVNSLAQLPGSESVSPGAPCSSQAPCSRGGEPGPWAKPRVHFGDHVSAGLSRLERK